MPMKLTLTNNTDSTFACSTDYSIQWFNNHQWISPKIKSNNNGEMAWETIRIQIDPNSKRSIPFRLFTSTYEYIPGRYRVSKRIINTTTNKESKVYCEFNLMK